MDASGMVNAHALQVAMFRMSQAGVKIDNTNMVLAELQRDWSLLTAAATGGVYTRRLTQLWLNLPATDALRCDQINIGSALRVLPRNEKSAA